jgi:hypothetical protein
MKVGKGKRQRLNDAVRNLKPQGLCHAYAGGDASKGRGRCKQNGTNKLPHKPIPHSLLQAQA